MASGSDGALSEDPGAVSPEEVIDLCRQIARHLPDYEILSPIGAGGQGMLFLGRQVNTDRSVAIKLIPPTHDGQASGRALREARVLAKVAHPNIANILSCGEIGGYVFLVMDYIEGESIDCAIDAMRPSVHELVGLYVKICRAVAFAHDKKIIHRDLTPNNILLGIEDLEPRVLDFGLARDLGRSHSPPHTRGGAVGTLPYMSPEQVATRGRDIDFRSDIYSLGVLFYYVMSATFPYGVEDSDAVTADMIRDVLPRPLRNAASVGYDAPATERKRVADDVEKIIFKAMEKDPDRRYQTADEMAEDFERFLRGEAVHAKAMSRLYVFRKFLKRHRVAATIGFVLTASSIGVATAAVQSANAGKEAAAAKLEAEAAKLDMARAMSEVEAVIRDLEITQAALRMADLNAEGNKLRSVGDLSKAAEAFQKALDIAASFESDEFEIRRREFGALFGLAEMYYIADEPDQAAPYHRKASELSDRMNAVYRESPKEGATWMANLAFVRMLEGRAAVAEQDWPAAANSYRDEEHLRRIALAADPTDVMARARLAVALTRLGTCNRKLSCFEESRILFDEARSLHLQNITAEPNVESHIAYAANVEVCIANWHIVQAGREHRDAANRWLDDAESRLDKIVHMTADRDRNLEAIRKSRILLEQRTD